MMAGRHVLCFLVVVLPAVSCFVLNKATSGSTVVRAIPAQLPPASPLLSSTSAVPIHQRTSTTSLAAGMKYELWHRLEIEEDTEPRWYLINCVATFEAGLLSQCRFATSELSADDVVKFVVPYEAKTRSHGAKKIVTENKVKYPGYVFAKLRLCPQTYEAIQKCPLCRSWMGIANKKGARKLPPRPHPLDDDEVAKFGLEALDDTDLAELEGPSAQKTGKLGLVVFDDDENDDDSYPSQIDTEALKVYKGLKVDDLIKVTSKGTFYNEDGVIRRLKDGRLFVRFYTYGQVFEDWLNPNDVRKLKAEEILRGLAPKPITQQDFDQPRRGTSNTDSSLSQPSSDNRFGSQHQSRNRRQDRNEQRFLRPDDDRRFKRSEEREGGDAYPGQQRNGRRNDSYFQDTDSRRTSTFGSRDRNKSGNDRGGGYDSNIPFGSPRTSKLQNDRRDDIGRRNIDSNQRVSNRQNDATRMNGQDDWNAFVSTPTEKITNDRSPPPAEKDDFFTSLMNDLNKDLDGNGPDGAPYSSQSATSRGTPERRKDYEDDFFASLLSDLPHESQASPQTATTKATRDDRSRKSRSDGPAKLSTTSFDSDDDFFASLEADLDNAVLQQNSDPVDNKRGQSSDVTAKRRSSYNTGKENAPVPSPRGADSDIDDFFASLEAELNQGLAAPNKNAESENRETEEFVGKFTPFKAVEAKPATKSPAKTEKSATKSPSQGLAPSVNMKAGNDDRETEEQFTLVQSVENTPSVESPTKSEKSVAAMSSQGSESPASTAAMGEAGLSKKTVPALKEMLRERGLRVSGSKAELVERLLQSS